ncbi:MAG: Z1 domain-containing protein [Chloroflexota bacterium]|nr:Z1 domain-containing protein [Chloroflexota bacterium]
MISNVEQAVPVVRILMQKLGCDAEAAARQLLLPEDVRIQVLEHFEQERLIRILDPYMILDRNRKHVVWLPHVDRATWYYWPRVRDYFLGVRNLPEATVNSVDDVTDRVLAAMENPTAGDPFTTKGLVLGYVQSGKTTNYSALIAKGADVGFRLFIVLSGIHNGLRLQTERRLRNELVAPQGVAPLDAAHAWKTFTKDQMNGDFDPGSVDAAGLASPGPGLLVVKKWKSVLDKLLLWIEQLPPAVRQQIPVMIIDDEADQATPNTGGNRPDPDEDADDVLADEAEPSRINERIRRLVKSFPKVGYVAYTATPFANVFIDHNAVDHIAGEDLYPRDFIVDLPIPDGYFGAERIFGRADDDTDEGLDVLRTVPDEDEKLLRPAKRDPMFQPQLTDSLRQGFDDFVLAGAAMFERGWGDKPASMLIHTSLYTAVQERLAQLITEDLVDKVKAEWRYKRKGGIEARLRARWESDFRRVTRSIDAAADRPFDAIRDHITTFLELLDVRSVNSASEEILDYDADPDLKVVVIGGNRLSRGLTLENLLVSYYLRPANQYDTLMQMGRWFGFRDGYVDLTRIYTTAKLAQWFRDLATVEVELREEIARYAQEKLTPLDFAVRVRKHPSLLPTSPSKMKWTDTLQLSFDRQLQQTITFPFDDTGWLRKNVETTRGFLSGLGKPTDQAGTSQPFWRHVPAKQILEFLLAYQMDPKATRVKADLLRRYIRAQASIGELADWIVAVVGLNTTDQRLGTIDLQVPGQGPINAMERTRIKDSVTLKAIVSAEDEATGLTKEQRAAAEGTTGKAFRSQRDSKEGLLLIYPISRMSGFNTPRALGQMRRPIFDTPEKARQAEDIIGVGLSFPHSDSAATVDYVIGTVGEGAAT